MTNNSELNSIEHLIHLHHLGYETEKPSEEVITRYLQNSSFNNLKKLPYDFQYESVIEIALIRNADMYHFANPALLSPSLIERVARKNAAILEILPETLLTEDILLAGTRFGTTFYFNLPLHIITEKVNIALIKSDRSWFTQIERENQTPPLIKAVIESGCSLSWLCMVARDDLLTDEMIAEALLNRDDFMTTPLPTLVRAYRYATKAGWLAPSLVNETDPAHILKKAYHGRFQTRAEAISMLCDMRPDVIAPHLKTEQDISLFKQVFGTQVSLPFVPHSSRRKWLGEDLGL